jgi:heme-degrading monooxygenase HmoA
MTNQNVVTEIVEFTVILGVSDEEFIAIVDALEKQFHSKQSGFLDTELLKGKDGRWLMVQHWESLDQVKAVVKLMMKEPNTLKFRQTINPTSVKMMLLEQARCWGK